MKYRIRIDLCFDNIDPANDILEHARRSLPFAKTIRPGLPTEEPGYIWLENCYHDQDPILPCSMISMDWAPK